MQKGTVYGADRSVYKQHFFPLDFFCIFCFQSFVFVKGLAGTFSEMFTFLITL